MPASFWLPALTRTRCSSCANEGSPHDSFEPLTISEWAGLTFGEGEKTTLRSGAWMPFPDVAGTQKSGSEGLAGRVTHPEKKRLYEATLRTAA